MKTEIYYFSGTGNSLAIAKDIANRMGGGLLPMASFNEKKEVTTDAEVLGIVFPVYFVDNYPLMVERFVRKVKDIGSKYIFAVCNYGGASFSTIRKISAFIESCGGRLKAGFAVHMPQSMFKKPFENTERIFNKWKSKLEFIVKYVNAKKEGRLETDNFLFKLLLIPLEPYFRKAILSELKNKTELPHDSVSGLMPMYDRIFKTSIDCNGCGICLKVCPVNNIKMDGDKPVWQHHCEACQACINWCPRKAIYRDMNVNTYYYRHPDVNLSDMTLWK
jgi:ferredoxin